MTEPRFTPGPWVIRESMTQIGKCYRISTESVIECGHGSALLYDDSTSLNPHAGGVQKANANLIAAAPEMYEALIEAANHLYTHQDMTRVRELAKAVIRKAEGRQ
jgi:hypothetical protein